MLNYHSIGGPIVESVKNYYQMSILSLSAKHPLTTSKTWISYPKLKLKSLWKFFYKMLSNASHTTSSTTKNLENKQPTLLEMLKQMILSNKNQWVTVPFHLIGHVIPIGYHDLQPLFNMMAPFATSNVTLRKKIKDMSCHMQQIISHI